jgi:hypothetical protein
MKKTSLFVQLMLITGLAAMIGCGGGGGGDAAPQYTKAIVTLSTTGTLPAGTKIGGIQVTVNLPAGVTAKASLYSAGSSTLVTDTGVITASGTASGSYTSGVYLANTAASTYKISMGIVNANGFSTGEFAQVSCDIAAGSSPTAADFSLSNFAVVDLNGGPLTGLTPGTTVAFQ